MRSLSLVLAVSLLALGAGCDQLTEPNAITIQKEPPPKPKAEPPPAPAAQAGAAAAAAGAMPPAPKAGGG
jgi:hypothetical protein